MSYVYHAREFLFGEMRQTVIYALSVLYFFTRKKYDSFVHSTVLRCVPYAVSAILLYRFKCGGQKWFRLSVKKPASYGRFMSNCFWIMTMNCHIHQCCGAGINIPYPDIFQPQFLYPTITKRGGKNQMSFLFLSIFFTKFKIIECFEQVQQKNSSQLTQNSIFPTICVGSSIRDLLSGKLIPDPPDLGVKILWIFLLIFTYYIQHCFTCRPSDSTVPTDAGIELRTVETGALAVRRSNY